jgi:hypothetical protein
MAGERRRPPRLDVDAERFPKLERHPGLERALRIRQALLKGLPRDEAVQLAEQAMGPRAPHMASVPKPRPPRAKLRVKATRPS